MSSALLQQMRADSPVALWRCNDASGTNLLDSSGNGRTMALTTTYTLGGKNFLGTPVIDFTGGYSQISDNSVFSPQAGASGQITLEAWINADTQASLNWILTKGAGSNYEWALFTNASGVLSFTVWTAAGTEVMAVSAGTTGAPTGVWTHVVGTFNRATPIAKAYVNGVERGSSSSATSTSSDTTSAPRLGRRGDDAATAWDGGLSHCAVYSTALSADRVKAHYEAGIRSGMVSG